MDNLKETIKYSILEKAEDESQTKILKTGVKIVFNIGDIAKDITYLTKKKTEIEAEVRIHEATKQNVIDSNPEVKEMGDKTLIAAFLYERSSAVVREGLKKLQEIKDALDEYTKELADVEKQTGLTSVIRIKPELIKENEYGE